MFVLAHIANLLATARLINTHVPEPYMDEIFHIPQAQQYCHGDYLTWDPKLTTPPGLYLISNAMAFIAKYLNYDLCTVNALRFTNILFSIGLYLVLASLVTTLSSPTLSKWKISLYALALSWFPVGFFYNFVYYTDPGSTFLVLLSYLLVKKKRFHAAGFAGIVSLTFRQTNVIWVCLFMMVAIMDTLSDISSSKKDDDTTFYNPTCSEIQHVSQVFKVFFSLITSTLKNIQIVLPNILSFILAIVLFALFLLWNGGIVLGDRSNHIAGLHFPQLFYYTSFLSFFAAPWTFSIKAVADFFLQITFKRAILSVLSVLASIVLVHKFTHEHPFILSDNRHYSFYVWKKIYKRHWTVRYLLSPVYVVSGFLNIQAFAHHTSFLLALGYLVALVLTLVPSPLLEFRYFIIPFLFYMVHIPPPKQTLRTWIALIFYFMIHIVTVYLFIYKPFTWPSEPGKQQRFMW